MPSTASESGADVYSAPIRKPAMTTRLLPVAMPAQTRWAEANPFAWPDDARTNCQRARRRAGRGAAIRPESLDPSARQALAAGLDQALNTFSDRISFQRHRPRVNGWDKPGPGPGGSFGTRYAVRAAIAVLGLAAKVRADGIHFNASVDGRGLVYEPDGSLVIYLQPDDPGPAHRPNWLPTPPGRTYELSLRAYWPSEALLNGQWAPPPIVAAR